MTEPPAHSARQVRRAVQAALAPLALAVRRVQLVLAENKAAKVQPGRRGRVALAASRA